MNNARARVPRGYVDGPDGPAPRWPAARGADGDDDRPYDSEVTVRRLGGVRLPVEVRVEFADGRSVRETWDGQYRWTRFRYPGAARVVARRRRSRAARSRSTSTPPTTPGWRRRAPARRAASKWAVRWMFWLQNLLELHTVLG